MALVSSTLEMIIDDGDLARRAASGETEAFDTIYHRYFLHMWKLARARLGNDSEAEEVVQDTFIKASYSLGGLRGSSLYPWLKQICINLCNDRQKRAGRREQLAPMLALDESLHSQDPSWENSVSIADRMAIREALAALPDAQRDAYVKVALYGYEAQKIAAQRGVPASTVRSQVSAARKRLHASLSTAFQTPSITPPLPGNGDVKDHVTPVTQTTARGRSLEKISQGLDRGKAPGKERS
jgi:RNA polymerase sigma-70 factor, ECF subfamily